MAFWGVEVKPGRPYTHPPSNNTRGRLHVSQATLGATAGTEANGVVFLQCNVGDKSPVYLCALSWEKVISCPVNAEFEEDDDVVFSVVGPRSVHLSGYYCLPSGDPEPPGEDIADSEAEQSVEDSEDDEYEGSFIDDSEAEVFSPSVVSSDEECLIDVVKRRNGKGTHKHLKKKHRIRESTDNEVQQTFVKRGAHVILSDSDIDDKCPISSLLKTKPCKNSTRSHEDTASDKRLSETRKAELNDDANRIATVDGGIKLPESVLPPNGHVSADMPLSKKKRKRSDNKSQQGEAKAEIELTQNVLQIGETKKGTDNGMPDGNQEHLGEVNSSEKKKKKKRRKIQENVDENKPSTAIKELSSVDKESSQLRSLPNGLIIEHVEMGRPDSEVAVLGKRVTIHYAGRVKEEGKQFDLSIDGENLKFRLGKGKVIKGLDTGIEGMRVGDRRRLTIPPSLGYGSEGNGDNVPPDSWLVYDVKLIKDRGARRESLYPSHSAAGTRA